MAKGPSHTVLNFKSFFRYSSGAALGYFNGFGAFFEEGRPRSQSYGCFNGWGYGVAIPKGDFYCQHERE